MTFIELRERIRRGRAFVGRVALALGQPERVGASRSGAPDRRIRE